jgi:hypothetical protein
MIYTLKRKLMPNFKKNSRIVAWLILMAIVLSLGAPVWSDEPYDGDETEIDTGEDIPKMTYDLPIRDEEELWSVMTRGSKNDYMELRYIESYEYDGFVNSYREVFVHNAEGEVVAYVDGLFEADENGTIIVPVYDEQGEFVDNRPLGNLNRRAQENDDVWLGYNIEVQEPAPGKVKQAGQFAVRMRAPGDNVNSDYTGFIWWSSPVNASHDPYGNEVMINNISSPLTFLASNHDTHAPEFAYSNTIIRESGSPPNFRFVNAVDTIDKIENGVRFNYHFPQRQTRLSMEIVLEDDSLLVTIPADSLIEEDISATAGASVMLTMSVLRSFGAGAEGEDGYIVVPDGSGAVIEFDNNKLNSAQYSGQVYGRDLSVSQRMAPTVTQQVYLPVFGIVRDQGSNALVAIAEQGDENAVVRATVSRQGAQRSGRVLANHTSYNLAWFDFNMRTADSFQIGTENRRLTIYEAEYIKTGDISVRYFPLAGENLSYVDVAHSYRNYLEKYKGVTNQVSPGATPFYMTLNGGTVKRHSIAGFPVNRQTAATTYKQAEDIINILRNGGADNLVIAYNDFNTASIRREISATVQYSRLLGGKKGFNSLMNHVSSGGDVLYPSLGFMEFARSTMNYNMLLHSPREVTRSRAWQQRYELAFGTPDPLQSSTAILSPFYFNDAIDSIIKSLKKEGITTVSLDRATSLLYSDFSRRNPRGTIYFNRRDTAQVITEGLRKITQEGISIKAQAANAYALPYVSHLSNVPLSSSNFDLFDYDIPFYQIVIQGLIPYSTTPFNANSNKAALTLLALSVGSPVHYEFMYANAGEFNDSVYNSKFYSSFHDWADDAIAMHRVFSSVISDVLDKKIIGHQRLGVNEYETEFEGGTKIYINLNTDELRVNGDRIDIKGGGN